MLIVKPNNNRHRLMRLRQRLIQLDGDQGRFSRLRHGFVRRQIHAGKTRVEINDSAVSQGVTRVLRDGLLEIVKSFLLTLAGVLEVQMTPLSVKLIRRTIVGMASVELLLGAGAEPPAQLG